MVVVGNRLNPKMLPWLFRHVLGDFQIFILIRKCIQVQRNVTSPAASNTVQIEFIKATSAVTRPHTLLCIWFFFVHHKFQNFSRLQTFTKVAHFYTWGPWSFIICLINSLGLNLFCSDVTYVGKATPMRILPRGYFFPFTVTGGLTSRLPNESRLLTSFLRATLVTYPKSGPWGWNCMNVLHYKCKTTFLHICWI